MFGHEQPIDESAETAINALRSLIDDPQKPLPDYSFRPRLTVRRPLGRRIPDASLDDELAMHALVDAAMRE